MSYGTELQHFVFSLSRALPLNHAILSTNRQQRRPSRNSVIALEATTGDSQCSLGTLAAHAVNTLNSMMSYGTELQHFIFSLSRALPLNHAILSTHRQQRRTSRNSIIAKGATTGDSQCSQAR